jgi:hypothetical protein
MQDGVGQAMDEVLDLASQSALGRSDRVREQELVGHPLQALSDRF